MRNFEHHRFTNVRHFFRLHVMAAPKERYKRTEEDVEKVIRLAKLDKDDLNGVTQVLNFGPNSDDISNIKLLEVDEHLLGTLKAGDSLTFRGDKIEPVVLCSMGKTYDVKEAETSNSLLLVPNLMFGKETITSEKVVEDRAVRGVFYTYYEVRPCKPRLSRLRELLEPSAYNGKEYESNIDPTTLYTWDRLVNEMQSSEEELRNAFLDYRIIDIDGYLRHVTFEYEARALTLMVDLIEENSWELDEVDKEVTDDLLQDLIPKVVFEVIFKVYTEPSGRKKENGDPLYRYNEELTCTFLARILLSASPVNEYNAFMQAWRVGAPEKMELKAEWLNGIALIVYNKSRNRKEVVSYPESDLSEDIVERFRELFKTKEMWTLEEISPYVRNVTTDKMNVNALLTKYARSSTKNGVKYYCAKHCK